MSMRFGLVVVGYSACFSVWSQVPVQDSVAEAVRLPIATEAINCSTSPFGSSFIVGGENEIFVGVNSAGRVFGYDANPLAQLRTWSSNDAGSRRNQSTVALNFLGGIGTNFTAVASTYSADNQVYIETVNTAASGGYTDLWKSGSTFDRVQLAKGNVDGNSFGSEELIAAMRYTSPSPRANALLVGYWHSGGGGIAPGNALYNGVYWTSLQGRDNVEYVAVASGDVNLNQTDEIVTAFRDKDGNTQLLVLGFKAGVDINTSTLRAYWIEELAFRKIPPNGPVRMVRVAVGDVNGDRKPDIVVAWGIDINDESLIKQLHTRVYKLSGTPGNYQLDQISILPTMQIDIREFDMTVGDTDGDGRAEVVLAYTIYNADTFYVRTYNAEQPTMVQQNVYQTSSNPRPTEINPSADNRYMSLATGDTDKDGRQDIIVAFRDHALNRLYIKHLEDQSAPGSGIAFIADYQHGYSNPTYVQASLGDWNNDSVLARYEAIAGTSLLCQQVIEPQILMAAFAPPYWKKLQSGGTKTSFIADSTSQATINSTGLSSRNSHSVSAYIGASVGGSVLGIGAEATAKATAGYEYATTTGKEQGAETGTNITEGWTSSGKDDAMVVYEQEKYNCYNYGLEQNLADVDGNLRFCQYVSRDQLSASINSWETVEGFSAQNALSWVPVVRDWASLALFRFAGASQSSTGFDGSASRAVDGNTDGNFFNSSVTHTAWETKPWWQVDLGSLEKITKIRLWNRSDCCKERLSDFYVFVSQNPFGSNNPAVLAADPSIRTYRHTGYSKQSISFLTRQTDGSPIKGRYVRVQLNGTGYLSLAEVQVFGENHVDPDRYPRSVTVTNPATGAFKVSVWDPIAATFRDVHMPGKLLFDGVSKGIWSTTTIGSGGSIRHWSLSSTANKYNTTITSTDHNFRVGAEFDFQAGAVAKVVGGGAYEFSSGVNETLTKQISWGSAFELGGSVAGFDQVFDTPAFSVCNYGAQPFSYEVTEVSSSGYEHKFLILDYVVPDSKLPRANWNNYTNCRALELNYINYFPVIRRP